MTQINYEITIDADQLPGHGKPVSFLIVFDESEFRRHGLEGTPKEITYLIRGLMGPVREVISEVKGAA